MSAESTPHPPDRPNGGGPTRPADHTGPYGRVWQIKLAPPGELPSPDQAATLQAWLMHAPTSHPFWSWYMLAIIHLRDLPGVVPAEKSYPEASHELMVAALDPSVPVPDPDAWASSRVRMLHPIDQVVQFTVTSDDDARRIGDLAALGVTSGVLIPDQDHRQLWREAITLTAEYARTGGHG